jgi:hypothetical protein
MLSRNVGNYQWTLRLYQEGEELGNTAGEAWSHSQITLNVQHRWKFNEKLKRRASWINYQ